ncbi:MAG: sigma factor-like helix-turn-helix DNA-binding protein [Anaerosomatales bacterium]|nr:sigma factor-like helix-turn-helix DNA-binding protein [Anaerosomatales bacterium]
MAERVSVFPVDPGLVLGSIGTHGTDPGRLVDADDGGDRVRLRVQLAVECLPVRYRDVIELRYYGRLSYREIGRWCDCDASTALRRERAALAELRRLIVCLSL